MPLSGTINLIRRIYFLDWYFPQTPSPNRPKFVTALETAVKNLAVRFCHNRPNTIREETHALVWWNLLGHSRERKPINQLDSPRCKQRILVLQDPVVCTWYNYGFPSVHRCFDTIFSLYDDLLPNQGFVKFVHPDWFPPDFLELRKPIDKSLKPFNSRQLCMMYLTGKDSLLATGVYTARVNLAQFMEEVASSEFAWHGDAGFYILKNAIVFPMTGEIASCINWMRNLSPLGKCYRAPIAWSDAATNCENYKFVICYEDMKRPGWVSERIFQALFGGAVPVYWGAPNIEDYIPRGCYIDRRDFVSNDELLEFMQNFTEEDYELHRRCVSDFLQSDNFLLFSPENFAESVLSAIFPEGYDRKRAFSG